MAALSICFTVVGSCTRDGALLLCRGAGGKVAKWQRSAWAFEPRLTLQGASIGSTQNQVHRVARRASSSLLQWHGSALKASPMLPARIPHAQCCAFACCGSRLWCELGGHEGLHAPCTLGTWLRFSRGLPGGHQKGSPWQARAAGIKTATKTTTKSRPTLGPLIACLQARQLALPGPTPRSTTTNHYHMLAHRLFPSPPPTTMT